MTEDQFLLQDLELIYGLTTATIAYITGVRKHRAWKWWTAQVPIPPK